MLIVVVHLFNCLYIHLIYYHVMCRVSEVIKVTKKHIKWTITGNCKDISLSKHISCTYLWSEWHFRI